MKKSILALALLLPLAFGCKKDNDTEASIDFGAGEGVSYRDFSNRPMAFTDPTDWTSDGQWKDREKALFTFDVPVNLDGAQLGGVTNMSVYPNPIAPGSDGIFHFNSAHAGRAKLIWVDKNYHVLNSNDFAFTAGGSLQVKYEFQEATFPKEQKYRLYYVLYKADGTLIYKGHGDVHIHQQ
ncbi:hypothetical protein [Hymenobacter lucidus]|uniref:Lipoprotein n=1 Tax=Hymenobacter lucidus TaxID=2880930 RepID=A0ABS8AQ52_9BACT|nr:hypothetical protein [Hymenobacter lucidus]MCB2407132.1 hypothetical protein [Hymenobacter lucidus]